MRCQITVLILIFQFHFVFAFAQKEDALRLIRESGSTIESFEESTYYKNTKIPFREIIVFDKRFDTTKVGYCNINLKIQLGKSFSAILNNYFKNNLDSSSDRSLVIFIKSFWLQKGAIDNILDKRIIKKPAESSDFGGSCTADIEAYSESNSILKALFKIDTAFVNLTKSLRRNTLDEFFFLPFDSIAKRLETVNLSLALDKKTSFSWEQVNKYYNNRLNIPVLKDATVKKGIFLTFENFRQNKPVNTDFKFSHSGKTDELYEIGNGNETLVAKYWGFCDGKDLFIRAGFSAFKAIRQQNAFEIFGAKHISSYDVIVVLDRLDKKILQVNMDTGKLY